MCKITAPDDEPQRGTVIQTDDDGRIATMPVGTPDRPVSRIISRDEYDRLNTPQGRSSEDVRAERGFGREQDLARQASRGISAFGPPSARANVPDVMGGYRPGDVNIQQTVDSGNIIDNTPMGINLFRDRDAQAKRMTNDFGRSRPPLRGYENQVLQAVKKIMASNEGIDPSQALMIAENQVKQSFFGEDDLVTDEVPMRDSDDLGNLDSNFIDGKTSNVGLTTQDLYTKLGKFVDVDRSNLLGSAQNRGADMNSRMGVPLERIGPNVKPKAGSPIEGFDFDAQKEMYDNLRNKAGLETTRPQVDMYYPDTRGEGIRSLDERGRNLQEGFEAAYGVNVPNDPYKAMQARIDDPMYQDFLKSQDSMFSGTVNRIGKAMGYDDPFELYKATQAQLERNKVLEADRNRDSDRSMKSQSTQQPFDPCPAGYKYDPAKRKCEPIEKEETELGQKFVRNPVAFAGDPNMYGRTGGEYNFFTEVPGLIKAANGIPRGPTGEIRGQGGPKDDLVGPFMLSDQEYVLPKEMIMAAGGGNYDTGIKQLETMRKNSLNKYGDYV